MATGADDGPDRRGDLVARIVAQGLKQADPYAWVRAFTLNALRALSADKVSSPAAKGEARREIHDLARLATNRIRAERLSLAVPVPNAETPDSETRDGA